MNTEVRKATEPITVLSAMCFYTEMRLMSTSDDVHFKQAMKIILFLFFSFQEHFNV